MYIDATQVNANAAYTSLTPRFAVEARAAIQQHLTALFPQDQVEEQPDAPKEDAPCEVAKPTPLPAEIAEEVRQTLTSTNAARHDWIAEEGRQQREVKNRNYQRVADFLVSTTDPDATPMRMKGGGIHLGYHTQYVVDGGKQRIIMQVLVTPAEVMENQPMLDLLWRVRFRWKLWPRQATGDKKYGTVENLVAIEREHLRAFIPSADMTQRRPVFSPDHFQYDAERDVYICPAGKDLAFSLRQTTETSRRYRARPSDCNACPLKAQCTTGNQGRSLCRNVDEVVLDRVRAYRTTAAYQKTIRKRSVWVEPLFAEGKDWHGMRRFRLRRLWWVNCEALVIAAGQNLKRLLSKRGWGRRPLPSGAALHWTVYVLLILAWSMQTVVLGTQKHQKQPTETQKWKARTAIQQ